MSAEQLQALFERISDDYVCGMGGCVRREEDRNGRMVLSFFDDRDILRSTVELQIVPATIAENLRERLVAVYDCSDSGPQGVPTYVSNRTSAVIAVCVR